ncbi:glycoside hydrolase family 30 beta sandwich domain-containing protein [Streptomyces sp. NBC_00102]|uniref:glycoside hydrolase family 30 beta sandwich domain-containing protein n=1 Tax=Streptomyces sp. NBC_00102 TaxID=2975652 RepID=UPI00224FF63F|nr:glycoside hydrolase family 30 beta sandwich domain-containing protein [Streptomyces sp. NBC_00102]MCX5400439.1 hypothetical protein [Streptomyces sp. NBC_00102]
MPRISKAVLAAAGLLVATATALAGPGTVAAQAAPPGPAGAHGDSGHGGSGHGTGVPTVADDGTVTRNAEYYTLGSLARFVGRGAVRIAGTSFGTTGWNGQVEDVAFRNPDGSTVLVAHDESDDPQTFAVREGDRYLPYTLPGGALADFPTPVPR